ncbi:MAG: hypothetical protein RH917_03380 [Lacipirellulaceae bacterium]
MQQDGLLSNLQRQLFVTFSVTLFAIVSSDTQAGVSFSSINGEIAASVPGDSQNELVSDLSGNDLSLQAFGGGVIDRAASSVIPTLSNSGGNGALFEFSATSTSSTNGQSDPPNEPRVSSSASFEQLFETDTAHRVTMIATVSQSDGGEASLQLINTQFPNSPVVLFGSSTGDEQYRSFFLAQGSYALSATTSSETFALGSSSGSVGGSLAVSVAADTSGDSFVDGEDLDLWEDTFGGIGFSIAANGDFNANFAIDGSDYLLWQQQFSPEPAPEVATVPSPSSALLACWAVGLAQGFRRRR